MNKEDLIRKWLRGELTENEMREFKSSGDQDFFDLLNKKLEDKKAPPYDVNEEYQKLRNSMDAQKNIRRISWRPAVFRIAAAVALLMLFYIFFFTSDTQQFTTEISERQTVMLPDSSMVLLSAVSSIEFDAAAWDETRTLILDGEAFFQVRPGSDFKVITDQGTVTVLGTEFNVRDRTEVFEVICYHGSVKVEGEGYSEKLQASDILRYTGGKQLVRTSDSQLYPHLLKNESTFRSVPFRLVLREFERHYDVTFDVPDNIGETLFTGIFTHKDMELALKSVTLPLSLTYTIKEDNRIILR